MFVEYLNNKFINETDNFLSFLRKKGFKIKMEIPRKQGLELVFYSVDDCIIARQMLKNYKTSIRDNSLFVYKVYGNGNYI